jgi:hypothetical protein
MPKVIVRGQDAGRVMLTATDEFPSGPPPNQAWIAPGMPGWDPSHEPSGPMPQGTGGPFWRMPGG